jgi:hypothetical protein
MADWGAGAQWTVVMAALRRALRNYRVPDAVQRFFSGAPQSRDPLIRRNRPRLSSAAT